MGMPLANAMRLADPAAGVGRSIRPMAYNGNANVTRPDQILFLSVTTTITRGPKRFSFTQSFELPQSPAEITLLNNNIRHPNTYIGVDPLTMSREQFELLIVEPAGQDVPCTICPPGYGETRACLDPDLLSDRVSV